MGGGGGGVETTESMALTLVSLWGAGFETVREGMSSLLLEAAVSSAEFGIKNRRPGLRKPDLTKFFFNIVFV